MFLLSEKAPCMCRTASTQVEKKLKLLGSTPYAPVPGTRRWRFRTGSRQGTGRGRRPPPRQGTAGARGRAGARPRRPARPPCPLSSELLPPRLSPSSPFLIRATGRPADQMAHRVDVVVPRDGPALTSDDATAFARDLSPVADLGPVLLAPDGQSLPVLGVTAWRVCSTPTPNARVGSSRRQWGRD